MSRDLIEIEKAIDWLETKNILYSSQLLKPLNEIEERYRKASAVIRENEYRKKTIEKIQHAKGVDIRSWLKIVLTFFRICI